MKTATYHWSQPPLVVGPASRVHWCQPRLLRSWSKIDPYRWLQWAAKYSELVYLTANTAENSQILYTLLDLGKEFNVHIQSCYSTRLSWALDIKKVGFGLEIEQIISL